MCPRTSDRYNYCIRNMCILMCSILIFFQQHCVTAYNPLQAFGDEYFTKHTVENEWSSHILKRLIGTKSQQDWNNSLPPSLCPM